jgi:hypothetical protein
MWPITECSPAQYWNSHTNKRLPPPIQHPNPSPSFRSRRRLLPPSLGLAAHGSFTSATLRFSPLRIQRRTSSTRPPSFLPRPWSTEATQILHPWSTEAIRDTPSSEMRFPAHELAYAPWGCDLLLLPRFLCLCVLWVLDGIWWTVVLREASMSCFLCVLDAPGTMCICNMLLYLILISIVVTSLFFLLLVLH